jgi:hypothetical protein
MHTDENAIHPSEAIGEARVVHLQLAAAARTARGTMTLLTFALAVCLSVGMALIMLAVTNRTSDVLGSSIDLLPAAALIVLFCSYRLFLTLLELRAVASGIEDLARIQQSAIYETEKWARLEEGNA